MGNYTNNRRVFNNTLILYIRMFITLIVSLYTSRVVLQYLGVDDFGIFNVVGGIVAFMSFITQSLTMSFQRFFSIEIAKNNIKDLSKIYSAALILQLVIIIFVLILSESIGFWFLNNILNISANRQYAANIVYQVSIIVFILTMLKTVYNSIIISYERFNTYALLSIFEVALKLIIVFMLGLFDKDKLIIYSILFLLTNILIYLLYYVYFKSKFSFITFNWKNVDSIRLISSFAAVNAVGSMSHVVKHQSINFIINIIGGVTLNAARTISLQVYTAVNSFVTSFQTAFSPFLQKSYVLEDKLKVQNNICDFSLISFFILYIIVLPICFATEYIFHIWLGDNIPPYTIFFSRIILIIAIFDAISNPIINVIFANGKIKRLQLIISFLNFLIIPISFILYKYTNDVRIVYYVDMFTAMLFLAIRCICAKYYINLDLILYFKQVMLPIFCINIMLLILCLIFYNHLWIAIVLIEIISILYCIFVVKKMYKK